MTKDEVFARVFATRIDMNYNLGKDDLALVESFRKKAVIEALVEVNAMVIAHVAAGCDNLTAYARAILAIRDKNA